MNHPSNNNQHQFRIVALGCRTGVETRNGNEGYYGVMTFVSVGLAPRFFLADAAGYGDAAHHEKQ